MPGGLRAGALCPQPRSARSRAVLDRLRADGAYTRTFRRHLALEEARTGSPLAVGNAVRLLGNGQHACRAMLAANDAATDHVQRENCLLDDHAVGQRFALAFIDGQRPGVQVNLVRDSVCSLAAPAVFFSALQAAGVAVRKYNPVNLSQARGDRAPNQRHHRKPRVVDGRLAFRGGIDTRRLYAGGAFSSASCVHADAARRGATPDCTSGARSEADLQRLFIATSAAQKPASAPPMPVS